MKTIRIFLLVLIIVGIIALCTQSLWVPKLVNQILVWQDVVVPGKTVTFQCDSSKNIVATFYPTDDQFVDLKLSDGRNLSVPYAISASGARYATPDETFVFWNKGNTAFITEGKAGTETYSNCVIATSNSNVPDPSPLNVGYLINGQFVALISGLNTIESAPGSSSKIVTRYFGNEAVGDLNGDGVPDIGFILTQNLGGSGTFFYVVAALKTSNGYQGTNAILLGDRIAPQTTEIKNGELIVNYADRAAGESMTTRPSVGVSKYLKVVDNTLVSVK